MYTNFSIFLYFLVMAARQDCSIPAMAYQLIHNIWPDQSQVQHHLLIPSAKTNTNNNNNLYLFKRDIIRQIQEMWCWQINMAIELAKSWVFNLF